MEPRGLGHPRKVTPILGLCLAALLAGTARGVAAQRPDTRASLERFRDSLAGVTDSAALTAAARLTVISSDTERQATAQLRRGLVALRAGELGNGRYYRRAESAFEAAGKLEPAWPWPSFGRALAKYGISESQRAEPLELGIWVGVGALDDAVTALTQSLALDP